MPPGTVRVRSGARRPAARPEGARLLLCPLLCLLATQPALASSYAAWEDTATTGGPAGRSSMGVAAYATSGLTDVLYMYGGISDVSPVTYSSELWSFTDRTKTWASLSASASGSAPPALIGSAMCAVGEYIFLVGGKSSSLHAVSQFSHYRVSTATWSTWSAGGSAPAAVAYHAMACVGTKLYIFGGQSTTLSLPTGTYVMDQSINTWVSSPSVSGSIPAGRVRHTLVDGGNDKLYLFGGMGSNSVVLNDVSSFDINTFVWAPVTTYGVGQTAREGHTALVMNGKMYVFGGMDAPQNKIASLAVLNLGSSEWSEPRQSDPSPPPRWGAMAGLLDGRMVLYGGVDQDEALLGDTWGMGRTCLGNLTLSLARASFASGDGAYVEIAFGMYLGEVDLGRRALLS